MDVLVSYQYVQTRNFLKSQSQWEMESLMTSYNVTNFNWRVEMVGSSLVGVGWGVVEVKTLGLPCRDWIPGEGTKISRLLQPEKKKIKNSIKFRRSNTGVNNDEMKVSILPRGKGTIKFIFLSSLHCEAQQKSCRCVFVTQLFRCLCLYTDLKTESSIATIMKWK